LGSQLTDAARELWAQRGGAGLVIVSQDVQGERFYLLTGSNAEPAPTATSAP
jgi:hypothetical protein